jgi:hypothetical protein
MADPSCGEIWLADLGPGRLAQVLGRPVPRRRGRPRKQEIQIAEGPLLP